MTEKLGGTTRARTSIQWITWRELQYMDHTIMWSLPSEIWDGNLYSLMSNSLYILTGWFCVVVQHFSCYKKTTAYGNICLLTTGMYKNKKLEPAAQGYPLLINWWTSYLYKGRPYFFCDALFYQGVLWQGNDHNSKLPWVLGTSLFTGSICSFCFPSVSPCFHHILLYTSWVVHLWPILIPYYTCFTLIYVMNSFANLSFNILVTCPLFYKFP